MPVRATTSVPSPDLPQLSRGVLIRIDTTSVDTGDGEEENVDTNTGLVFQYNPDLVTRARTGRWEARSASNTLPTPQDIRSENGSGAGHLMADSETISLKIIFDATEEILAGQGQSGVLSELAFLETASLGRTQERRPRNRRSGSPARSVKPDELLLVLGRRRFPVVMTGLTIVEQKFTPDLTPIRAEVDLRLTVLEPAELAFNTWVDEYFTSMVQNRKSLADDVTVAGSVDDILASAVGGNPDTGDDIGDTPEEVA